MNTEIRNAVVTGGGRGIGRAIATVLAARGAAVAVWDRTVADAEETVASIREAGGTAVAVIGDVADSAKVADSVKRTRSELGPISILVNNAAVSEYVPFVDITDDAWDRMIRVNLKGPFLVTKAVVPDMLAAGWGRIINISSSSAQSGGPLIAHYAASKGGLIGLTKALAIEYAETGITVNHVPPSSIDTPLLRDGLDPDEVAALVPMKRTGQPEDIAYAVAYLASEQAGFVTGQTLSVNGGRYLA